MFVLYAFTWTIYQQASGTSNEVNNASIAFADEDQSAVSEELVNAFYPPRFQHPVRIRTDEIERVMDEGRFMFVVVIPPQFERDLKAGRQPDVQVNIDATAMQQAGIGAGYIHNIITQRLATYLKRTDVDTSGPVNLVQRKMFNPNGVSAWFSSIVAIMNQISLLTIVLTGAAVIREREHGTLEHLLVMPLTALRDRNGEGRGEWSGDSRRNDAFAVPRCTNDSQGARPRIGGTVVRWRSVISVLCDGAWRVPRNHFALNGAVRAADRPGGYGGAASFRRIDSRRKPARLVAGDHVFPAVAALRQFLADHHLPRRRTSGRVAQLRNGSGDWTGVLLI